MVYVLPWKVAHFYVQGRSNGSSWRALAPPIFWDYSSKKKLQPYQNSTKCTNPTLQIFGIFLRPWCYVFISLLFLVYEESGKKHSQILEEQRKSGGLLGGGLRYPMDQLVIFWVQCDQEILDQRCNKRVDQMIAEGLLGEMQVFHEVWLFWHPWAMSLITLLRSLVIL